MIFGPFWWLAPIEYGFHRSKSTQRPSREPDHTRVIVRLRGGAAGWAVARPIGVSAAAAVAATAPLRTLRRPVCIRVVLFTMVGSFPFGRRFAYGHYAVKGDRWPGQTMCQADFLCRLSGSRAASARKR